MAFSLVPAGPAGLASGPAPELFGVLVLAWLFGWFGRLGGMFGWWLLCFLFEGFGFCLMFLDVACFACYIS